MYQSYLVYKFIKEFWSKTSHPFYLGPDSSFLSDFNVSMLFLCVCFSFAFTQERRIDVCRFYLCSERQYFAGVVAVGVGVEYFQLH